MLLKDSSHSEKIILLKNIYPPTRRGNPRPDVSFSTLLSLAHPENSSTDNNKSRA